MKKNKEKIYVFGHRNPDTDSITASIALSHLKNELGLNTIPVTLSNINNETKYALDYFKVEKPIFLNDVKLKIKDVKYEKKYFIKENHSLLEAYNLMIDNHYSKIPVVDINGIFKGMYSMKDIAKYLIHNDDVLLETSYDAILNTIEGEEILRFDEEIKGITKVASYKSTTFIENVKLTNNSILVVGDRHSIIEYAVNSKIKLLILSGNSQIKKEHLKIAKQNKVNIIKTNRTTLQTIQIINLANKISSTTINEEIMCVNEEDTIDNFINIANKTKYSYFPVLDKHNKCLGIITLADTSSKKAKKVILVDHNNYEQSIEGIKEAEILEVIDHHNIGSIGTSAPINFRNNVVGSTNTIIYQMYKENNIKIPAPIAGLMASGIISDTLLLKSPTTTEFDKIALKDLAKKAKIDIKKYGLELLKAGASIEGKTKQELLYQDFKIYPVNDTKIGIGQISTTDPNVFLNEIKQYQELLNNIANDNNYLVLAFFINDLLNDGSYVIYNETAEEIMKNAFNHKHFHQGIFLKHIVSRKLQMVPAIIKECKKED